MSATDQDQGDRQYCAYVSFAWADRAGGEVSPDAATDLLARIERSGVALRGTYGTSVFRADCDLLFWMLADSTDKLDEATRAIRTSGLGPALEPFWNAVGVHLPAEFNASHVPAFVAGDPPGDYICLYPFVRSLEWYVLPPDERREMLAEHGRMARGFGDVRANTVSSFGLGDYEWLLAFEAPEPTRIVELMRTLRAAKARLHTRHELPFITGARRPLEELVAGLQGA